LFLQAEDGIRAFHVTGVQTCALPIWERGKTLLPFSIPDRVIQGPIPYDRVPYVYASSKVVLGVQNHGELLTRRTWECIGTGGLRAEERRVGKACVMKMWRMYL